MAGFVQAQSVFKGRLIKISGEAYSGVNIFKDGGQKVATTDSSGFFSFETDFVQTLHIFGYQGKTRAFAIEIEPNANIYKNIIVPISEGDGA